MHAPVGTKAAARNERLVNTLLARIKAASYSVMGALTKVTGGLWTRYGGLGWTKVRLYLPGARFDWEKEAADVWMNSIVGLAISWLGDRFSRPIIHVSKIARNGDHIPLGRHDLVDLWNRPNPHYSRRTMEKAVGLSLKCDGNAYLYKVRDRMGEVVQLWWVPHFRILPTWPADGSSYIDGYMVWLDTAVYHLKPEDIIHIRDGIDPRNERLGLSALRANLREVCTINMEGSYTAALLKNSGVPGLAIVPDSDAGLRPSPEAAERIKERFGEEFGGDHAGGTAVMAGRYKIVEVGFSPEKLKLDVLPQAAVSRIAAAVGVAPMSLGLPDPGKTYSNLAEANRSSWGTIVSIQELIAESLRFELLPDYGLDPHAYVVEYDYAHVQELQESLDAVHLRTREDWKAGVVRLNEAREQLGFEPDPDGDRYFLGTTADMMGSADGEPDQAVEGGAVVAGNVQETALNGAQIASLVQIVQAVAEGTLPGDSARGMIAASFPNLDEVEIESIVKPAESHEMPSPEPAPMLPAPANGNGRGRF